MFFKKIYLSFIIYLILAVSCMVAGQPKTEIMRNNSVEKRDSKRPQGRNIYLNSMGCKINYTPCLNLKLHIIYLFTRPT